MNGEELFYQLPALPVLTLLETLARAYAQSDDPDQPRLPLVTLHLRSGRDITGWILKLAPDAVRGDTLLVRAARGEMRSPTADILYVAAASVEAVTAYDAPNVADILSQGQLSGLPSSVPAPSRLELQRLLQEHMQSLASELKKEVKFEVNWESIPDTEDARRSLAVMIKDAAKALGELNQDDLGRQALSPLQTVRLAASPNAKVEWSSPTLSISYDLAGGRKNRWSRAELKSRMSAVF